MTGHTHTEETQVTCQKQLKEVGYSHKDTPDMSLPVHVSSGPTAQMSWV